jgi:hypothetical protein
LIAVVIDGEYKVAQYGQWDFYPSGQGAALVAHLMDLETQGRIEEFENKLRAAKWISEADLTALWTAAGADANGSIEYFKAEEFGKKRPEFSRNTGAGIIDLIMASEPGIQLQDSLDFAADSLFCEWAYVIDMDNEALEVYKGFNKEPLPEGARFADMPFTNSVGETYYPVKLIASLPLSDLDAAAAYMTQPEEEETA